MWPQTSSVPFVSANTGGLPLEPLLRQDEGESLRGKAETLTWLLPSFVKPGPMTAVPLGLFFLLKPVRVRRLSSQPGHG